MNRRQLANMENEMTKRQMQGCEVLEIDGVDPERALLELRDGKFWDGEPATRKEDGTTPMEDGFYFVELDGGRILNDNIYGPYADVVEAELAAREGPTLTDLNRAITELERKGHLRRVVDEDGVPRYQAVGPLSGKNDPNDEEGA
jgi:hypothetical protein